ncbi:MAG TPA: hypothetical protein VHE10_02365 [Candidatus Paceibacterota bacterium]|nr:hypothetical protein [Candidatus Paceibacterota bacterium]
MIFNIKPALYVFAPLTEDGKLVLLPWQGRLTLPYGINGAHSHDIFLNGLLRPYFEDVSLSRMEPVIETLEQFWFEGKDCACSFYSFAFRGKRKELGSGASVIPLAEIPSHAIRIEFSGLFQELLGKRATARS